MTGVHTITITYCECDPHGSGVPPRVQLLRTRWFPATWKRPGTAFTFRLLDFLHKLHSNCKVNLYNFHTTIADVLDNAGLRKPLVSTPSTTCKQLTYCPQFRYNELSLVFCIFVYLRQLQQGGCAHVVGGLSSLLKGTLAVECLASSTY